MSLTIGGFYVGVGSHGPGGLPKKAEPDPAAETEQVALHFSQPDSTSTATGGGADDSNEGNADQAGKGNRRRVMILSGAAVLAVAAAVVAVVTLSGGSTHPTAAGSSRQDSQLREDGASSNSAVNAPGQAAAGQANASPASGLPMSPSPPGGVTGPPGSDGTTATTSPNPSQPPSTATTTKPGQPPNPVGPTTSGNQPTSQPSAGAKPAAYAGRLASGAAQSSTASTSVTLHTSGASSNGDTLLVSVMLTNTRSGGVGASDSAGNSYSVVADQTDGAGDRTLILAAVNAKALSGGSLTVTYPATLEHHVALDDFTGVKGISGHASNTAASGSFASGNATGSAGIAFGVAGVQGGENASWSGGFTALPTVFVSADQLATAYETIGSGSVQASGSCNHQWMAAVVTLAG